MRPCGCFFMRSEPVAESSAECRNGWPSRVFIVSRRCLRRQHKTKDIMAKLIHIQASPRGGRSASRAVAACFLESYRAAHPGDTVDTLDLWQTDLPEINGATLDAAYAAKHGQPHSPEQLHVWQAIVRIVDHFKLADFSLPMWNSHPV